MTELFFAFLNLATAIVFFLLADRLRCLFREIRKLAQLYPPYPTSIDDGVMEQKVGSTSVYVEDGWKDDGVGRD